MQAALCSNRRMESDDTVSVSYGTAAAVPYSGLSGWRVAGLMQQQLSVTEGDRFGFKEVEVLADSSS